MSLKHYESLMSRYGDTLKETSKTTDKPPVYMTDSPYPAVNFDAYKYGYCRPLGLTYTPKSCDALFFNTADEWYLIEFKNGVIEVKKNSEIKFKMLESLLLLMNELHISIEEARKKISFVLVYNETLSHGEAQFHDCYYRHSGRLIGLGGNRQIRFGLARYKGIYFKDVYTYSKSEFKTEFVDKQTPAHLLFQP